MSLQNVGCQDHDNEGDAIGTCADCDESDPDVGLPAAGNECDPPPDKCGGAGDTCGGTSDCCQDQGGPVRPLNGTMYYTPPADLSFVDSRGNTIELSRSYQSRIARWDEGFAALGVGALNQGWRFNFEMYLSLGRVRTVQRVTVHFGSGDHITFLGPQQAGSDTYIFTQAGTVSETGGAYRMMWNQATQEIRLIDSRGRVFVFAGYAGAAREGTRVALSAIIEPNGARTTVTLDPVTMAFRRAQNEDGVHLARTDTASGFTIDLGRGATTMTSVAYEMANVPSIGAETHRTLTRVSWQDGRDETLQYTAKTAAGVAFDAQVWSNMAVTRIGFVLPVRWQSYILLSEVRDGFGSLVERHSHNTLGQVVRTERPGETLTFAYSELTGDPDLTSRTTVTNTVTSDIRVFYFRKSVLVRASSNCSGCSDLSETKRDTLGRRQATRDKRGTWTVLSFVGESNRIQRETENGDPSDPGAILDASTFRTREYQYQTNDPFAGTYDPMVTTRPSVLGGSAVEVRQSFDPNDENNTQPTPLLRFRKTTGTTASDTQSDDTRSFEAVEKWTYTNGRLTRRLFPRSTGEVGDTAPEEEARTYHANDGSLNAGRLETIVRRCDAPQPGAPVCTLTTYFADYDVFGHARRVTEPSGIVRRYSFGTTGLLLSESIEAPGRAPLATTYTYERARLTSVTTSEGVRTELFYVAPGLAGDGQLQRSTKVLATTGALIEESLYEYTAAGLRKKESVYVGGVLKRRVEYVYGQDSRLSRILKYTADAASPSAVRDLFYDAAGDIKKIADENHATLASRDEASANTDHELDALGRLKEVKRRIGAAWTTVATYSYDSDDNLRSVVDGNGRQTRYVFDDFHRLVRVESPDSGATRYLYDRSGNLIEKRDAYGVLTRYAFDAANRVVAIDRFDAAEVLEQSERYAYDSCFKGALCSVSDASGDTVYSYDPLGRLVSEVRTQNGGTIALAYRFDARGRVETMTYPSGRVLTYLYSDADPSHVAAVTSTLAGVTAPVVTEVDYDENGIIAGYRLGNGALVGRMRDFSGQAQFLVSGAAFSRSYLSDGVGNIRTIGGGALGNQSITYDALDRIDTASGPGYGSIDWDFDLAGNRTRMTDDGIVTSYAYAPATNQLTSAGATTLAHDARGNVTTRGPLSFTYDSASRLREVRQSGALIASYAYDYRFRRVQKDVGGIETYFAHDGSGNLLAEIEPCLASPCDPGSTLRSKVDYVYLGSERVAALPMTEVIIDHQALEGDLTETALLGAIPPDSYVSPETCVVHQDVDRDAWQLSNDALTGNVSLELSGNTWKTHRFASGAGLLVVRDAPVLGTQLTITSELEFSMKALTRGEAQGIGVGDGSGRQLIYIMQGSEHLAYDYVIDTDRNVAPLGAWNTHTMPIALDWLARYGDLPFISEIYFVNDNDDVSPASVTRFDNVRLKRTVTPRSITLHRWRSSVSVTDVASALVPFVDPRPGVVSQDKAPIVARAGAGVHLGGDAWKTLPVSPPVAAGPDTFVDFHGAVSSAGESQGFGVVDADGRALIFLVEENERTWVKWIVPTLGANAATLGAGPHEFRYNVGRMWHAV
ncbi:MAG: RHS repeat protein, partial [Deltaproteobacteria bacterium]|nr:RHS repeat protein [Deltaproteobacteria bacterium]